MQLIQLIEPTSIDIRNKMSTLGEAIENNQINGAITDKGHEVCDKFSPNENDTISNSGENMKGDNHIKVQLEDNVKGFNGIVKTNRDAQTLSVDSYKIETRLNVIINNESAGNSQSNESSSMSESCTNSNSGDIDTTTDENTNLDNVTIYFNQDIISRKIEADNVSPKKADVSLNEKKITDVLSIENKPVIDAQAAVSCEEICDPKKSERIEISIENEERAEKISDAKKTERIEISIENEEMAPNVSAFSPNSDTNEGINISAQIQQLENDASIEDDPKNSLAEHTISATNQCKNFEKESRENDVFIEDPSRNLYTDVKITAKCEENTHNNENKDSNKESILNNDKLAPQMNNEKNQTMTKMTKEADISGASQLVTEKLLEGDQSIVVNIAKEMDLEMDTDDKLDGSSDIFIEETPSIEKDTENKPSMDVVNKDVDDITNNMNETMEIPNVVTINQSSIGSSDNNTEGDNCKPINLEMDTDDKLDSSSDIFIEETPSIEKDTEDKPSMDVVNKDVDNITNNTNEKMEIPNVVTINQSAIGSSNNKMEGDNCKPINLEMDTDNKLDSSSDIFIEETPLIEKDTKDKPSMDVVNKDVDDITTNINEKMEIPNVATINQSSIGNSDNNMEVDDCKPIDESKLESSENEHTRVKKEPSVQKYITCKKFTDMVYPVIPTTITENIEASVISDEKLNQLDQGGKNNVMIVDGSDVLIITPENRTSLDTLDKKPLVLSTEIGIANNKTFEDKTMAQASDISKEKQVMTIEQQEVDNGVMEVDSVVMEIKDNETPIVEESVSDIVDKDETVKKAGDNEICEKSGAVINITDNDDEDIIKSSVRTEVIFTSNEKPSSDVEIVNEVFSKVVEEINTPKDEKLSKETPDKLILKQLPVVCKLSNTMDILSDDEEDLPNAKPSKENTMTKTPNTVEEQNKCINIDDDDDIMFIEDTNSQDAILKGENKSEQQNDKAKSQSINTTDIEIEPDSTINKTSSTNMHEDEEPKICEKDSTALIEVDSQPEVEVEVEPIETQETKPLITKSFLKLVSKNLADMTRNELEDFCIVKLVESVVDKSNLSEIKNKMKTMAQTVEDLRKKAFALSKQNRDLQVVVKTVQEDQKKRNANPMMPMKITRSVGMQVVLSTGDKGMLKKKLSTPPQAPPLVPSRPVRNMQSPKTQKPITNNIPVPRLVPASSPTVKPSVTPVINTKTTVTPARNTTPQRPEKRPHNKQSPASSVTVDLTDDEPPAKINTRNPTPPVRLVPSQSLMPPKNKPQFATTGSSPRKVYIPISSSNPNVRQPTPTPMPPTVMKNFIPTPRVRQPSVVRMQTLRVNQLPSTSRHPAPLPDAVKQYQAPSFKALPPAPDLKLSKVDNGIVISWKFEGYQPETYEEVASFQLYAYQETTAPASTALWKKIGDIKALPLPMACTLTQFMSGFKYYFAVRAIDVRSRIGPFSLPGSILLISKN